MTRQSLLGSLVLAMLLYITAGASVADDAPASALGQVHFMTSCSPAAQAHFDRAVAFLHTFSFAEALRTFHTVLETDGSCAMGYWGLAMGLLGNPLAGPPTPQAIQEGEQLLRQARPVGVRTEREYDYLAAVSLFYKDTVTGDHRSRVLAYAQGMERLATRYPDDPEASIFYALALNMTADPLDTTYAPQGQAAAILEKLLVQQAQHPGVLHYLVQSYDYPALAAKGLTAARRYASLAPPVPYALHVPSHIFTRLGLWPESIAANHAAVSVAQEALRTTPVAGLVSSQALHAMDYMLYGHLQLVQDQAARRLVEELRAMQTLDNEDLEAAYALAAMPARYALERRRWEEAAALTSHPNNLAWERFPQAEAVTVFAHGLGAARTGNMPAARQALGRLESLRRAIQASGQSLWAAQTEVQHQIVSAWLARAQGKNDAAVKLLQQAATVEEATDRPSLMPGPLVPARELLGELLLELKQPALALQAYVAAQRLQPQRFRSVYGAARAAALAGDHLLAHELYSKLLALSQQADSARPEIGEAFAFLAPPPEPLPAAPQVPPQ